MTIATDIPMHIEIGDHALCDKLTLNKVAGKLDALCLVYPFSKPKSLTTEEIRIEALGYYQQWSMLGARRLVLVQDALGHEFQNEAAFLLHQAVEAFYHCVLLTFTLYSPKSHRISVLRSQAENLDDQLRGIWPSENRLHRQAFDRLRRAYVEARYSADYQVTDEELNWLVERVSLLQDAVKVACKRHLFELNV